MAARRPTTTGTPKLSDIAKCVVAPTGIVSTAWPSVRDLSEQRLGIEYDPWQHAVGRLILAKRADGRLAATIEGVGISIARQVGKTYLLAGIIFSLCILRPKTLVIWSAHHARTHGETFLAMQNFAARRKVAPYIRQVFTGSGDEEIRFRNGSRILFGARERGFGRGIPGVDVIVADEAQIMSERAVDAQLATMNTSTLGLGILAGTPPRPEDPSDAFTRMRDDAWAGRLKDGAWIEFGADDGANPDHRRQWRKANPSYPRRTPAQSILRLQRKLSPDSFRREALGIWDAPPNVSVAGLIDLSRWSATDVAIGPDSGVTAYGVKFSASGELVALSGAVRPEVGPIHIEGIDHRLTVDGTRWLVDWLAKRKALVVIDGKAGAGALAAALRDRRVPVKRICRPTVDQVIAAHAGFVNAVHGGDLTHLDDDAFNVSAVVRRPIGNAGGWGFAGRAGADVTLIESAALAHWGAAAHTHRSKGRGSNGRRAVTL